MFKRYSERLETLEQWRPGAGVFIRYADDEPESFSIDGRPVGPGEWYEGKPTARTVIVVRYADREAAQL